MLDLRQSMFFRRWVLPLFLALACCPRCSSGGAVGDPRAIVLITLDTTRADRMGFLGSQSGLTPHLDALARDGVVFTHAYAQVPVTSASHATILTGTYPQFHQVNDAGIPLRKEAPYAPEIFRRNRYQTAAFVGCVILDPKAGGAPGFDRGFDTYDAGFHARRPGEDRFQALERRGADVVTHAITWLDRHAGAPVFLWVHLYDPHAPYDPPEPFKSRYAADPYDGEVAYADSVVGKLLDQLRAKNLYHGALLAVMADHGEAFGEHGERGHGTFLYDPTIHVPLLLKLPGGRFARKQIDTRVELADVLPTILQAAGLPVPAAVQGKSLLPLLTLAQGAGGKRPSDSPQPAYAETDYPHRAYGWSSLRALRTGKYLFIQAPHLELYDESSDPGAEHNLAGTSAAVTQALTTQLETFRRQTSAPGAAPQAGIDPHREEQLRALGYVSSSNQQTNAGTEQTGPDPKDKIETANQMTEASLALEDGHYQEAIALLQKVVARDPLVSAAYATLGNNILD
jgi:arylsulfatase A-like enzyme